jgi:Contractile injection system tube protein
MNADASNPERAFFTKIDAPNTKVVVHFNPNSLQYTITNTMRPQGSGASRARQHVSESTGKLTMDLVFDTTDTGVDVRTLTEKIAAFMKPTTNKAPPVIKFEWGTFIFKGIIESYKETIDFFAPIGVPLRASVNLTLSTQDKVFELDKADKPLKAKTGASLSPSTIVTPSTSPASTAAKGGNPAASRALATANGLESLRFSGGASLTVDASITLGGPIAFASGGAGIGIGASAGIGIGVSAGASFGASAGASFGSSASAGVSASQGAFAGLRVSTSTERSVQLDTSKLIQSSASIGVATDSGATFAVGGQAKIEGSTSLNADVGATASLKGKISFD